MIECERVLHMFSKRFQNIRSIFIITHHGDELNIPYDNQITVIKDSKGVSSLK